MTRDEAVDKVWGIGGDDRGDCSVLVRRLEILGLLKLDMPKTPEELLSEVLGRGTYNRDTLKSALTRAGLKVVRA